MLHLVTCKNIDSSIKEEEDVVVSHGFGMLLFCIIILEKIWCFERGCCHSEQKAISQESVPDS